MARNVSIVCRYYQVRQCIDNEVTDYIFDLRPWLQSMATKTFAEKYKDANGIRGRLEEQAQIGVSERYALNFMRMEDFSSSYILNINDAAEHIDIDVGANEYIAKNTVCLYDADNGIIMIQCNRGSYSEKSIESYINSFFEEPVCALWPILEKIDFFGEHAKYMKLDVRLANLREYVPTQGESFEKIVDGVNRMDGLNAHIEISLGTARNARLNSDEVRRTVADLDRNRGCVTSAKIKLSDDQLSGVYDLFDNLCRDIVKCVVDPNGGVAFEVLANRMNDIYYIEHANVRVLGALINN